ncbi:UDP-N-acetylglucosamine 4,6-dehydratase family protein [uncultured Methanobrevibacter sp.]|uniref:UDP-N-acetylglucosamine 4,6-dehydratase family protein n=1 Tax=uncultured Methanobrevibacter sp. TaxID=253161 RepID=UPI0025EC519E|nr:UDP-N-acetylglucosamine 4,6-dehydratase family protein [uncultured Methanobrevibacter sp.]
MFNDFYKNKKILVTGGSGSIGKKIVKELNKYDVDVIRVLDNNETELFDLSNDFNSSKIKIYVGDINNPQGLKSVFKDIDIIFHAAAYKHVPLCEYNPISAVKTNILGTQNVIDMAVLCDVEKVVLISTDKAVHPENVMGATKFLAERLMMAANTYSENNGTKFSCVRFGNVLNSRGSVIPLFKKQLKNGGPITLTDEDMTRFIMNIYQAAKLILQAGSLSQGGEIFILKMPAFKLHDLVDAMIEFYAPVYGYNPEDIDVKIIGKRPGEKLYEELMTSDEMLSAYDNGDLFIIHDELNKQHPDFIYNSNEVDHLSKDEILNILKEMEG